MAACALKKSCSELHNLLRSMGVDEANILQECDEGGPCQAAFDNAMQMHYYLNVDNARCVSDFLKQRYSGRLPITSSGGTIKQIFDQRPFGCPELEIEIRQPCRVRSCSYWTNHSWARNCILLYRSDQGRESLDLKELTFLLDQTSTELRKRTNVILAEMRRWALRNKTEHLDVTEMPTAAVEDCCCVCVNKVGNGAIHKQGLRYCSRDCHNRKPPLDFRIEQEFRLPVDRVLRICIDSFAAKRPMCHALNVTSKQLDDLCGRYEVETSL